MEDSTLRTLRLRRLLLPGFVWHLATVTNTFSALYFLECDECVTDKIYDSINDKIILY